jgi:hypothetical protein
VIMDLLMDAPRHCESRQVPRLLEQTGTTFRRAFIHSGARLKDSSTAANSVLRSVYVTRHRRNRR